MKNAKFYINALTESEIFKSLNIEVTRYLPPFSRAAVTCLKVVTSSSSDSLMERSRAFCPSSPLCNLSVLRAVCISDILRAVLDPECLPDCLGEGLAPTASNTD